MKYYAVKTTGIYCREGCKSRAPRPENVAFFAAPSDAERAGFRPCKRCRPQQAQTADERFVALCRAIENAETPPSLDELARIANMSPFHLQRTFKRAIGVTPKQYARTVKQERLRREIDAGFGEPGSSLGMTPAQLRDGGRDADISFTITSTAIGRVLIAATERGICRVDVADDDESLQARLREFFPNASFARADEALESAATLIARYLAGNGPWPLLPLDVRGTAFQARVWNALRDVAPGKTLSYSELAAAIGSPRGARAVARACAANPIALLIPCHRIVPQGGGTGGYRWSPERKEQLLALERRSAKR